MSVVRRGRVGSPEKRVGETQTAGPVQGAGLGRTTGQHEVIVTACVGPLFKMEKQRCRVANGLVHRAGERQLRSKPRPPGCRAWGFTTNPQ